MGTSVLRGYRRPERLVDTDSSTDTEQPQRHQPKNKKAKLAAPSVPVMFANTRPTPAAPAADNVTRSPESLSDGDDVEPDTVPPQPQPPAVTALASIISTPLSTKSVAGTSTHTLSTM